jgi:hypothetical protein
MYMHLKHLLVHDPASLVLVNSMKDVAHLLSRDIEVYTHGKIPQQR